MLKIIDDFLNGITMYRLMLYYLMALILVACFLALFKILPFSVLDLVYSTATLVFVCWITNKVFAKVFKVSANVESFFITALILALIITPPNSFAGFSFLFWAAILSMASKYFLVINRKHIFNPAAIAVFITALALNKSASWWVGNLSMLPVCLIGGLLIVRKLREFKMVATFFAVSLIIILAFSISKGTDILAVLKEVIFFSPILFFAFVMFTEPLTTPPAKKLKVMYGALVGFLFAPQIHIGSIYSTPEIALLLGNIFSFIISPKVRLVLKLKDKLKIAANTYAFAFSSNQKLSFLPGQYMEWTLGHKNADSRGNRRYFTIASSPTEKDVSIGVKFSENSSSFKKKMISLGLNDEITASQLAGEFVLPENPTQKLVFMAGGIGITPFRSIIKYLLDTNQKREIILFYSNKSASDIAYKDLFDLAQKEPGIKVIYWDSAKGYIDEEVIKREVPDFAQRTFYLSGPHSMVDAFEKVLKNMNLPEKQIKTDFFPGYT